jgi:hypothetical protein
MSPRRADPQAPTALVDAAAQFLAAQLPGRAGAPQRARRVITAESDPPYRAQREAPISPSQTR